jgi:hypothetical protein
MIHEPEFPKGITAKDPDKNYVAIARVSVI